MKGYKGFAPGLVCRCKQYAENTVFEEEKAVVCNRGMHFCDMPFGVLKYYGFVNDQAEVNDFAEVEALDETKTDDNEKFCTKKLKVGVKIGIPGLVKAQIDYVRKKAESGKAGGDRSNLAGGNSSNLAGGDWSNLAGGDRSNLAGGDWSNLAGGDGSLLVGRNECRAKGGKHSVIVLTEWKWIDDKTYAPVAVKAEIVDGERIKENTFYKLVNGEFVEV